MTDNPPGGFAPPEPIPNTARPGVQQQWAPPQPPVAPGAAAWGPPSYAMGDGGLVWAPPPPPPPRTPMSTRALVAIVGGVVAALTVITVVVVLGAQLLGSAVSSATTGPPMVEGEDAVPLAATPLDCATPCFTHDSIQASISTADSYHSLGLDYRISEWGDYESSTPAEEYRYISTEWRASHMSPDECFFTFFGTPIVADLGDAPDSYDLDVIEFTSTFADEDDISSAWQSTRLFETSAAAVSHMESLHSLVQGCTGFEGDEAVPTTLAPAPALDTPDSVAVLGWTEVSLGWRYYVYDVQRGNLVVRTILTTPVDGVSEPSFRAFVERVAVDVAAIEQVVVPAA